MALASSELTALELYVYAEHAGRAQVVNIDEIQKAPGYYQYKTV